MLAALIIGYLVLAAGASLLIGKAIAFGMGED